MTVEGYSTEVINQLNLTMPYTMTQVLAPNNPHVVLMNPSPSEYITAQANAFNVIEKLRAWMQATNPTDGTPGWPVLARVNHGPFSTLCNAAYLGLHTPDHEGIGVLRFAKARTPPPPPFCENYAFSTIVSHEHGHLLNELYGTGNSTLGMGEGNADVWAMYVWDTPIIGQDIFGPGTLYRSGNNTRQYCGAMGLGYGCYGESHADGEPWMGAAWKVRRALKIANGDVLGRLIANVLFAGWLEAYDQQYIDEIIEVQWLTLDDDDGNLCSTPPTPHAAAISSGFRVQGFPGIFCLP